jgi:hypothetical protein
MEELALSGGRWPVNAYIACLSDTLTRLLEVKGSEAAASALNDQAEQAYGLGRVEALTNSLDTWKNQLDGSIDSGLFL